MLPKNKKRKQVSCTNGSEHARKHPNHAFRLVALLCFASLHSSSAADAIAIATHLDPDRIGTVSINVHDARRRRQSLHDQGVVQRVPKVSLVVVVFEPGHLHGGFDVFWEVLLDHPDVAVIAVTDVEIVKRKIVTGNLGAFCIVISGQCKFVKRILLEPFQQKIQIATATAMTSTTKSTTKSTWATTTKRIVSTRTNPTNLTQP
mmetsp:Transcript_19134/g.53270  ORF Transcript_19134/g.53270 Transcript_19134/m.53270 type:complete len:204 (-) Transcript_19134:1774-2385(-)